ncbi:MAG: hypothetical protein H6Q79_1843, partial [Deltaproteobacteria bacterium]|nr:hypothetical protein [Deltaproteobacteria bacterium]
MSLRGKEWPMETVLQSAMRAI